MFAIFPGKPWKTQRNLPSCAPKNRESVKKEKVQKIAENQDKNSHFQGCEIREKENPGKLVSPKLKISLE